MGIENRKSTRLVIKREVIINDAVKGYVLDINEDVAGMFIHTHIPFAIKSIVTLNFTLDPGTPPYNIQAEIRYAKTAGVGVLFVNVPPKEIARMKAFVHSQVTVAVDLRKQILIVDDSAATRTMFMNMLVLKGYGVREAKDGAQALAISSEHAFDLLLIDLLIKDMDITKLLESLRANDLTRNVPVVILFASQPSDMKQKLTPYCILDFLPKMLTTPKKLVEKVDEYLARKA